MKDIAYKVNNLSCSECGQDHCPVTIELEQGGFIRVPTSAIPGFERTPNLKRKLQERSHIVTPDIFWPEEEEGLG